MRIRWQLWLASIVAVLAFTVFPRLSNDMGPIARSASKSVDASPASKPSLVSPTADQTPRPTVSDKTPSTEPLDWSLRIRTAMLEPDPGKRREALLELANLVELRDIPAILAQLSPEELATEFANQLVMRWAQANPASAGTWVAQLPAGKTRSALLDGVVSAWWQRDPHATISWVMVLNDPDEQLRLWIDMDYDREPIPEVLPAGQNSSSTVAELDQRLKKDIKAASAWAAALPEGPDREAAIKQLAVRWVTQDMRAAVTWVNTLPRENERKLAFTALLPYLPAR